MKRIRLLILLSVLAVALPVGLLSGPAGAAGGSPNQVSINRNAQFDLLGGILHVGLRVRCAPQPTFGFVEVHVKQEPPESPLPARGDGFNAGVVCDGQTHDVGVSVFVTAVDEDPGFGPFDAGTAYATATLFPTDPTEIPPPPNPVQPTATAAKTITIIVMPG
jgi:hypothetical protein